MKSQPDYKSFLLFIFLLFLSQFACSLGGQTPQEAAPTEPQAAPPVVTESIPVTKSERGTPEEANAMLQQAIAHYNTVGRDQALADFTGKVSPFYDRDLYVVCIDGNGIIVANGGFPQYVDYPADVLKDAEGNSLGKAILEAAAANSEGSIHYNWINPISNVTEPKVLFFEKAGADVCGVGAYNP